MEIFKKNLYHLSLIKESKTRQKVEKVTGGLANSRLRIPGALGVKLGKGSVQGREAP